MEGIKDYAACNSAVQNTTYLCCLVICSVLLGCDSEQITEGVPEFFTRGKSEQLNSYFCLETIYVVSRPAEGQAQMVRERT